MNYIKTFISWLTLKEKLDTRKEILRFSEREIWMCHFGENIGFESCGKNDLYHRPVLILHKFGAYTFYAIPLSTKLKEKSPYHFEIEVNNKKQSVLISQMRLLDVRRLHYRKGKLSTLEFKKVKSAFLDIFKENTSTGNK